MEAKIGLYAGHLGTPNEKWWPSRRGLDLKTREFEAESISYLVCNRLGIASPSDEYLSGYFKNNNEVPSISLDCVMKASGLIEQMGRERLPLRKSTSTKEPQSSFIPNEPFLIPRPFKRSLGKS